MRARAAGSVRREADNPHARARGISLGSQRGSRQAELQVPVAGLRLIRLEETNKLL